LLKDNLDGLDVKALDAALATPLPTEDAENARREDNAVAPRKLETSEPVPPLQVEPAPSSRTNNNRIDNLAEDERGATTAWRMATEADQKSLLLNNRDVREVQGRLTALNFDPKGIDGSVGPGTRAAIANWQSSNGIPATGYLDAAQLLELKTTSQAAYSNWLQTPSNRRLVEPPPPIALGPNNVSGVWTFVSRCGPRSRLPNQRINGVLNIIHSGNNNYTGRVRNSQGLNGNFSGTLRGRNLNSQINWGLLFGRVQMTGRIADNSLTLSGRDSNGCSISARKQ
jgi:peptidoglycan hydrolase-like protein with peptidoglycan-binding domain